MSSYDVRQRALEMAIDDSRGDILYPAKLVDKARLFETYLEGGETEALSPVDMFKVFAALNEAGLYGDDIMKAYDELKKRGVTFRNIKAIES